MDEALTPQKRGITRLLRGLNNGIGMLAARKGPPVLDDSSSDDEFDENQSLVDLIPRKAKIGDELAVGRGLTNLETSQPSNNVILETDKGITMAGKEKKQRARKQPSKKNANVPKNTPKPKSASVVDDDDIDNDPKLDPPRKVTPILWQWRKRLTIDMTRMDGRVRQGGRIQRK